MNANIKKGSEQIARVSNQLGTFGGVFTPSILTIFGVIMFMRTGFVIGEAGIFSLLVILLISKSITLLTSLSISAVSTNTPVAGGGAYFLISRSLGPEFGGTIGLALFSAQAISVPFYVLGFTEALVRTFPDLSGSFRMIAIGTTVFLFMIAYVGAKWAVKAQYVIMVVLGLAIVTFLGGAATHFQPDLFRQNWQYAQYVSSHSFWGVFAIFFPAVTGIMAGVNMSGDLKDPKKAIPMGTLAAVGVGFVVYGGQILLCGGSQTQSQLLHSSFELLREQALFGMGFLVSAGVYAATLSSAIGSFLGAPRVLQAVARDKVIPVLDPFAKGTTLGDEPRRALIFTLVISFAVILWAGGDSGGGAFNILAAVVTMFFLYTYGMLNLAAFIESFSGNPSFRPRFRYYHWTSAICGTLACMAAAVLVDPLAAIVAGVVLFGLYSWLKSRLFKARFGDARWGFMYSRLRANLLKIARMPMHSKNWRPTILVLTGNPETRLTMTLYALWIGEERGLVTLARILEGDFMEIAKMRETAVTQLKRFLVENDFDALSTVVVSHNINDGLIALIQGHAVGPLSPNIVFMGWSSEKENVQSFVRLLNTVRLLGKNLIAIKDNGLPKEKDNRRIDIWWRGQENGSLMVILSHLLTLNWEWSEAKIRLLRLIQNEAGREPSFEALTHLVDAARVDAEVEIVVSEESFVTVLHRHSVDASVVMLGFNVPEEEYAVAFQENIEQLLSDMPTTLLVSSSGDADLLE
ncbi:MAG: amino acid permease [Proteobacteria bacterium]|nr:amino acid permease [Pseudomonadota bacterium]MBU4469704.1 amino acid permease [Pseudomonadota bacterium]MCG2751786.1 amino acid permease [Desulfobacteraceae bacterium]